MPKYTLTESADKDLTGIYAYTYGEFGERQADAYFTRILVVRVLGPSMMPERNLP